MRTCIGAKLRSHRVLFSSACLLFLLCLGVSFFWFYLLLPRRRVEDERWREQHTEKEVWNEVQKSIRRTGWWHNDCFDVGNYGGKEWVAWIMDHIRPGDDITGCRAGYKESALCYMTNQDVGDTAEAWIGWWEANREKSQEEWVREGFEKGGLVLHSPPMKEEITALLRVIGENRLRKREEQPRGWWYNAFRWLRDNDFDPCSFRSADLPQEDSDSALMGLVEFARLKERWPKHKTPGVLKIGRVVEEYRPVFPGFASTWCGVAAVGLLIVLFAGGGLCLWFSLRSSPKKNNP